MRAYVGAVREQAPDLSVTDILGITPEQGFAAFAQRSKQNTSQTRHLGWGATDELMKTAFKSP